MSAITRITGAATTPLDLLNLSWLPMFAPPIRIEEYVDGDRYVLRAELPGVDPQKDITITLVGGELRVDVTRAEAYEGKARSEFHYGSFSRVVTLPTGVREDTVKASYAGGILAVTALVGEPLTSPKSIPITVAEGGGTVRATPKR